MKKSIRTRLTVFFISLAVIPLVVVGTILTLRSLSEQQQQAINLQHRVSELAALQATEFIQDLEGNLYLTAQIQNLLSLDAESAQTALTKLQSHQDAFEELSLLDSQGQEIARVSQRAHISLADLGDRSQAPEFLTPFESGESYYARVRFDSETGEPYMLMAIPLVNIRTTAVEGVLVADVRFKAIWDLMASIQVGETGSAFLVERDGDVIAHPNPSVVLRGTQFTPPTQAGVGVGLMGERAILDVAKVPLGSEALLVVTERSYAEAMADPFKEIIIRLVIMAGTLVIAAVLGWLATRQIVEPIQALVGTATAVKAGDLSKKVPITTQDEIGTLAEAFNEMTTQLQSTFADLEQRQAAETEQRQYLQERVTEYSEFMRAVGQGDLAKRMEIALPVTEIVDPLVELGESLNSTTADLQGMILKLKDTAGQLNLASAEILATTSQQAASAAEQAAAVSETSTTFTEVRQTAEQAAQRAHQVSGMTQESLEAANQGLEAVQASVGSMNDIKEQVNAIAENILSLSEQTQKIGEIISSVNDIADQSNLLALNAAIEAARAGEAGKGFAVVAGEVRNLARQSQAATAQVRDILQEIQKAANAAVMVTEEGTKRADLGVTQVSQTGESIQAIQKQVMLLAQAAQQIAASAQQQLAGMEQTDGAMQDINQATVQTQAGTQQVEESAQNLNRLAEQLEALVDQYRLE